MTWAKGTSGTASDDPTTALVCATSAVSVGDVICCAATFDDGAGANGGVVTDSLGNTYTKKGSTREPTNGMYVETYMAVVTVAGTPTITIRLNPTPGTTEARFFSFIADPFTGSDASSVSDGSNAQWQSAPGTGADAVSSNTYTTTVNGDLIYAACCPAVGDTVAHGTGFTTATTSGGQVLYTEYATQTTAGAGTKGTFTATAGSVLYATASHAVTPASGGGGGVPIDDDDLYALQINQGSQWSVSQW